MEEQEEQEEEDKLIIIIIRLYNQKDLKNIFKIINFKNIKI